MLLSKISYFNVLSFLFILLSGCTKTEPSEIQKESFIKNFGGAYGNVAIDFISNNGSHYVLGNITDDNDQTKIFLAKTDEYGNRIWANDLTYSIDNKQTLAGQIIKLEKQQGFAIIGAIEMDDSLLYYEPYFVIIDENGTVVTETTIYQNTFFNDYGKCIGELENGGFTISTLSVPVEGAGTEINVISTASTGAFIKKASPYAASELFQICKGNNNGRFYIAAYSNQSFIILINTDGSPGGTLKFERDFGRIKSIVQDKNENTFVCGDINNGANGGNDGFIAKLTNVDLTYAYDWRKVYGNSGNDNFEHLLVTENDEILVTGSIEDTRLKTSNIWVMKTNILGNKLSETMFGGDNNEYGIRILASDNNKYVVEGTTYFEKNGFISIYKSILE